LRVSQTDPVSLAGLSNALGVDSPLRARRAGPTDKTFAGVCPEPRRRAQGVSLIVGGEWDIVAGL
jgi:hypothetical protein